MKSSKLFTFILALLVLSACTNEKQQENNSPLTIKIDYGNNNQRTVNTVWEKGLTALEALQHVALTETHPVGKYVFVTAIDSVRGVRGKMAWYYNVNGQLTKKLAIINIVSAGDTISWIYKTDVCSAIVDKQ